MTFKLPRTVRIIFEDGIFAGAEVVCRIGITLRESLEFANVEEKLAADPAYSVELVEKFFDLAVVAWNLVDDDERELPLNAATLAEMPGAFILQLMEQWKELTQPVPKASTTDSTNGSMSAELSAVMAQSSQSLAS